MNTKYGYSQRLVNAVHSPDATWLGAELGRACIAHGYSVIEVAEVLKVSRQTVYNWMRGTHKPPLRKADQIQVLIDKLQQLPLPSENG